MKVKLLFIVLIACLLASCSIDNTLYNARKYFREAQARPIGATGRPNNQAIADYTKCIQKCGYILTERPRSSQAPEALYLMARALYYKGNSSFQALDQFQNLIRLYPESKLIPDAYIYLAKVNRDINRIKEAEAELENFIRNPQFRKHHARALLVLADFEIKDKDYHRAQYWLEKILTEYSDAKEHDEAFFLFGKNYYVQGNYSASLTEFEKMIKNRKISKDLRQEAEYYTALNLFMLNDYERSYKIIRSNIKNESRPDKLSQALVLKARLQIALKHFEDAVSEFDYIMKTYPRTAAAAEANYYLAEYKFYKESKLADAATSYNRVRTELSTSDFANIAQRKANAINQFNQNQNQDPINNLQQYLDYNYQSADNYINPFELPDSALVIYDRILSQKSRFVALADSLGDEMHLLQLSMDSLATVIPEPDRESSPQTVAIPDETITKSTETDSSLSKPDPDTKLPVTTQATESIVPGNTPSFPSFPSMTSDGEVPKDTYLSERDSTEYEQALVTETISPDSVETILPQLNPQQQTLQSQIDILKGRIEVHQASIRRFDQEIIPYINFLKAAIYKKHFSESTELSAIYSFMTAYYAENKYTTAIGNLIEDKPIRLIDPVEERAEQKLDLALSFFETAPDSMIVLLNELKASEFPGVKTKTQFRLGWFYTFEQPDTLRARDFLDEVLKTSGSSDYATLIRRFYDGRNFLFNLPKPVLPDLTEDKTDTDSETPKDPKPEDEKPEETPSGDNSTLESTPTGETDKETEINPAPVDIPEDEKPKEDSPEQETPPPPPGQQ